MIKEDTPFEVDYEKYKQIEEEKNLSTLKTIDNKIAYYQDKADKRKLDKFKMAGCLLVFVIIMFIFFKICEVFLNILEEILFKINTSNLKYEQMIEDALEVFKALIFTISGYLFSKRED